jgi:type VI secretion system protein VasD
MTAFVFHADQLAQCFAAWRKSTLIGGLQSLALACCLSVLSACSSAPKMPSEGLPTELGASSAQGDGGLLGGLKSLKDKALETVGLKAPPESDAKPKVPDNMLPDRRLSWRVHASTSLNITETGESLAVVLRFYQLKAPDAFLATPMDAFSDPTKEKQALGEDLIAVREVMMVPGRHHETIERMPRTIGHVGVVAMFRQPAASRWRYAFDANRAELTGIRLGVHACALSVQQGQPVGVSADEARQVSVRCPANPYRPDPKRVD